MPLLSFLDKSVEKGKLRILRIYPRRELHWRDLQIVAEIGRATRKHSRVPIPTVELSRFYFDHPLTEQELQEGGFIERPSEVIKQLWAARDRRFEENFGKPDRAGEILADIRRREDAQGEARLSKAIENALDKASPSKEEK
jgi:hypothetical protein